MEQINLSWVITTRNKLLFLKEVLSRLISDMHSDEEIVIIDGGSTDGTVEYLTELYNQGKIHQFVSEPDRGEAEGYNKGILRAKGILIKLLSDDDAFYLPAIRDCKNYMLSFPEIDILATNGERIDWSQPGLFCRSDYTLKYQKWTEKGKPFLFGGLGIMFRKKSIAILGLLHTGLVRVDAEFALRITSGKARFAFCTACTFVRITNPKSNSVLYSRRVEFEGEKLSQFYLGESIRQLSDEEVLDIATRGIGVMLADHELDTTSNNIAVSDFYSQKPIPRLFQMCDEWLVRRNHNKEGIFLNKNSFEDCKGSVNDWDACKYLVKRKGSFEVIPIEAHPDLCFSNDIEVSSKLDRIEDDRIREKVEPLERQLALQRQQLQVFSLCGKSEGIIIFGAGGMGKKILKSNMISNLIKHVVDNDSRKWGQEISGFSIKSPDELLINNKNFILVASIFYKDIKKQLSNMGFIENKDFIDAGSIYTLL